MIIYDSFKVICVQRSEKTAIIVTCYFLILTKPSKLAKLLDFMKVLPVLVKKHHPSLAAVGSLHQGASSQNTSDQRTKPSIKDAASDDHRLGGIGHNQSLTEWNRKKD